MAYIKYKNQYKIGEVVKTTIIHESCTGFFEIGTYVKIIAIGERGYDIQDNEGNCITEIGWVV